MQSAVENVKKLFADHPNEDVITIPDALHAWGRDPEQNEVNKKWLSNKLTHLRYNNLITPIYSFKTGYRTLDKLQLTLEGKEALGRVDSKKENDFYLFDQNIATRKASISDVLDVIRKFKKENQDFDVTFSFDVKLKPDRGNTGAYV